MVDSAEIKACLNCGAGLNGMYCAACGQQDRPLNPSILDLLHDMAQQFFDFDGRIFRSLKTLLLFPGLLTQEYLNGRRAAWMAPIRLYFVISVAYFTLSAVTDGSNMWLPRGGTEPDGEMPAEALAALQSIGYSSVAELEQAINEASAIWMPRVMFIMIPIFAALVQLLQRGSGLRYPQNLIFALHVQSAWFVIFALLDIPAYLLRSDLAGGILYVVGLLGALAYLTLALNRTYGGRLYWTLFKAVLIGVAYGLVTVTLTSGVIVPLVL